MQLEVMLGWTNEALEKQCVAVLVRDLDFRHHAQVMQDAGDILAMLFDSVVDEIPHSVSAGNVEFPVLLDDFPLRQVHENTVLDSLPAGIGVNTLTE